MMMNQSHTYNQNMDFYLQSIVDDSMTLPSLEDLDEVCHAENLRTILSVMAD